MSTDAIILSREDGALILGNIEVNGSDADAVWNAINTLLTYGSKDHNWLQAMPDDALELIAKRSNLILGLLTRQIPFLELDAFIQIFFDVDRELERRAENAKR